ncbi:tRNA (adenosine(37)-N6)-dimethylallyltransferase MiaA [soil metagenome]
MPATQAPHGRIDGLVGFLAGPTASGKSALAVAIAQRHNLAIISADSMQVYRGMEIGTGAMPESERGEVPHRLLSVADPREAFNASRFAEEARTAIAEELTQGRRSLVVGGTGMWIQALREGLFGGPGRDEGVRARLRDERVASGAEALHAKLAAVDPPMAAKLPVADHVRIIRALEVFELSGRPLTEWYAEDQLRRAALEPLAPLVVIHREREELRARINARTDQMLRDGWLEESRRLRELDLPPHSPAAKALGYPILWSVLDGALSIQDAAAKIKIGTLQYAKAQVTWFKVQRGVVFVEATEAIVTAALQL